MKIILCRKTESFLHQHLRNIFNLILKPLLLFQIAIKSKLILKSQHHLYALSFTKQTDGFAIFERTGRTEKIAYVRNEDGTVEFNRDTINKDRYGFIQVIQVWEKASNLFKLNSYNVYITGPYAKIATIFRFPSPIEV